MIHMALDKRAVREDSRPEKVQLLQTLQQSGQNQGDSRKREEEEEGSERREWVVAHALNRAPCTVEAPQRIACERGPHRPGFRGHSPARSLLQFCHADESLGGGSDRGALNASRPITKFGKEWARCGQQLAEDGFPDMNWPDLFDA